MVRLKTGMTIDRNTMGKGLLDRFWGYRQPTVAGVLKIGYRMDLGRMRKPNYWL